MKHRDEKGRFVKGVSQQERLWTPKEIEVVQSNYGKIPASKISLLINRSQSAISHKANRLGFHSELNMTNLNRIQPRTISLTEEEKTYLAGLIDGDGCITIAKRKRGRGLELSPQVSIYSKYRYFIEKLRKMLWGKLVEHQHEYGVQIERINDVIYLLEGIIPHLRLKKERAEVVLKFAKSRLNWKIGYSTEEKELLKKIRILNARRGKEN